MIFRILSYLFVTTFIAGSAFAQSDEEKAKAQAERAARVLTWTMTSSDGYLGIQTRNVSAKNYAAYGLPSVRGVAVEKVVEGSPAANAGLRDGDVILRFNGEEVTSDQKLTRLVGEVAPDHQVRLTISRSGAESEINVTIGKRPAPRFESGAFTVPGTPQRIEIPDFEGFQGVPAVPFPRGEGNTMVWRFGNSRQIGVGLTSLTKQLSEHFGVKGGSMINNVRVNSPAANAGLRAGDIIVEIDGKEVANDVDIIRAISDKAEGDVAVTFVRNGTRQTVQVTPEKGNNSLERLFQIPAPPDPPKPPGAVLFPGRVTE
ncbi:hypothetical protein BH24ACI3_BH24ACI3_02300 [soil metagenome]